MLFHHLHHLTHGARHAPCDDCRSVRQALRDADFADVVLELFLQPEAERSNIVLWNAATIRCISLIIRAQVLLDILIACFDGNKSLSFVLTKVLEDELIGGLC